LEAKKIEQIVVLKEKPPNPKGKGDKYKNIF